MKILQVNTSLQLGGAETVARQLFLGSESAGHRSGFAAAIGKTFPHDSGIIPLYPRLLSKLQMSRFHRITEKLFPRLKWTDSAFRGLASSPWEIIHIHNFQGEYASIESLGFLAQRKPLVWTFHGCWGFTGGCDHTAGCTKYQDACGDCPQIGRWSFLSTDNTAEQLHDKLLHLKNAPIHAVSPSRWLAAKIKSSQVGEKWDIRVIPNGVKTQHFDPNQKQDKNLRSKHKLPDNETILLVVNRNFRDGNKGFSMAAEALRANDSKNIHVILAGQNSDWAASQLSGISSTAAGYIASQDHLRELYTVSDILLFASPEENFPCTTLEAMASGCCLVSTPTGGVCEQVTDGENGFLATGISGAALAQSLREALENPARRQHCANAGRERVEREFDEKQMITRYLELYQNAAEATLCS